MDQKYDDKFEEMKKYIPFLEDMIKRLESSSSASGNPRQAQLDKIRSLRDLLLNKKKRMKMENLLKCEQVLINLYAKVEQKDYQETPPVKKTLQADSTFSIESPTQKEKLDLEAVRNKLKSVIMIKEEPQDTLPEILSRNQIEEDTTSGNKEPALFQRRPNRSPSRRSPPKNERRNLSDEKASASSSATRRNYTRVLVSPETSSRRWSSPTKSSPEKPLFSRRSPHRSQRMHSSYYKKERRKSLKESQSRKSSDVNITLNVPEDSLGSLNTTDLLPRILNCSNDDVDIETLRKLKKQILGELKKTGAKDDISDLLLNSYKKKSKSSKKAEVEEGEISDSESETIENVYSSLIVKEKSSATHSKIQICLVINPDKDKNDSQSEGNKQADNFDLEMYDKSYTEDISSNIENKTQEGNKSALGNNSASITHDSTINSKNETTITEIPVKPSELLNHTDKSSEKDDNLIPTAKIDEKLDQSIATNKSIIALDNSLNEVLSVSNEQSSNEKPQTQFIANFYKPLPNLDKSASEADTKSTVDNNVVSVSETDKIKDYIEDNVDDIKKSTEIPLLNEPTVANPPEKSTLSEIDILQALKNEILNETIALPGQETSTPLLHQPKLVKVASAQEILPKKRISIEKYKQKVVNPSKPNTEELLSPRDDTDKTLSSQQVANMKTSLKLTEKECERFKIPKISFDEDSFDEVSDDNSADANDIYSDLAPKSPDNDESNNIDLSPPVIIPADPVKTAQVTATMDIDMRSLPLLTPSNITTPKQGSNVVGKPMPSSGPVTAENKKYDSKVEQNLPNRPFDPRVRRDLTAKANIQSPNPHAINPDRTPRPLFSNLTPSPASHHAMTPNARTYDMTPSHQTFEIESSNRKHVYVPTFTMLDGRDRENSVSRDREKETRWEGTDSRSGNEESRDVVWKNSKQDNHFNAVTNFGNSEFSATKNPPYRPEAPNNSFGQVDCPSTPSHSFGMTDCPSTPGHPFGRSECPPTPSHAFGRSECPTTPSHPFGRSECPTTPSHPFGRSECPSTPNHPFGRSECPPTPNHPFGRLDCPLTPSHPFGRTECPTTPSHPFGRAECPTTPSHPFGRSECPPTPSHGFGRQESPATPSHSFGRSEGQQTPSHPFGRSDKSGNVFGRSDYNVQKFNKDPRLRKSDYDSYSKYEERERSDKYRSASHNSQNTQGVSDSYRNYEREHVYPRNSRYRYYKPPTDQYQGPDNFGRSFNRQHSGQESNIDPSADRNYERVGRKFHKEYPRRESSVGPPADRYRASDDGGKQYYIEHSRRDSSLGSSSNCFDKREFGNVRDGFREKNVASHIPNNNYSRSGRAQSVGRKFPSDSFDNILSVKPQSGNAFRIDTSVNTTFQNFLEKKGMAVFDSSFDARRRRAGSVGRTLVRETSVERPFSQDIRPKQDFYQNKRDAFKRAASVGRDLAETSSIKSFQEIKADFKTCNFSIKVCNKTDAKHISKSDIDHFGRSRKDIYEKNKGYKHCDKSSNSSYSPRKNKRDPRMHKEFVKNRNFDVNRQKKTGFVYSNDNIVKGAIMSTGYGVKNYKIPKIKRPIEEILPDIEKDTSDDKKSSECHNIPKNIKEKVIDKEEISSKEAKKEKKKKKEELANIKDNKNSSTYLQKSKLRIKDTSQLEDATEIRQTRSRIKKLSESPTPIVGTSKTKKAQICYSDSDDDNSSKIKDIHVIETKEDTAEQKKGDNLINSDSIKQKDLEDERNLDDSDSNFALGPDELETFVDNVAADPVIDSIDNLIADLDKDLHESKNNTTNNISNTNTSNTTCTETKLDTSADQSICNDYCPENIPKVSTNLESSHTQLESAKQSSINIETILDPVAVTFNEQSKSDDECDLNKTSNENIVSTTGRIKDINPIDDKINQEELNIDRCSTPDSTLNVDEVYDKQGNKEGVVVHITSEVHSETNVSSTQSVETQPSSSSKEVDPTIGNLLSILQDKSKIKELLSILGDQSGENEKIKKKLEKLSEIVSDDENDDNSEDNSLPKDKPDSKKDSKSIESEVIDDKIKKNIDEPSEELLNGEKSDMPEETNKSYEQAGRNDDNEINSDACESRKSNETANEGNTDANKTLEQEISNNEEQAKRCNKKDDSILDEPENAYTPSETDTSTEKTTRTKKVAVKKTKVAKKDKGKFTKKTTSTAEKRITRATAAGQVKPKIKKKTELLKLQEDIKDMLRDDMLSATGIRMCRLVKLVGSDKNRKSTQKEDAPTEPIVMLEKHSFDKTPESNVPEKPKRNKLLTKSKSKNPVEISSEVDKPEKSPLYDKYKPGPKSKRKITKECDPYAFETDSVGDTYTDKTSDDELHGSSDSEDGSSLASLKSFGSSEILSDIKKKTKRKRNKWQAGVIKSKTRKKKSEMKPPETVIPSPEKEQQRHTPNIVLSTPDAKFFTDKSYCFRKNETSYSCRLCTYTGRGIVHHYKQNHPHVEIPLSRMAPMAAKEAIEQCREIDFKVLSKVSSEKYVCIFCYKEFVRNQALLETFFWHIVSTHTGEYKQLCSECDNISRCPFTLDIPPPPKDIKGQLIGYICKKCNFTQISLENLKTHVIHRHNDEQTAVYAINLAAMTNKSLKALLQRCDVRKKIDQIALHSTTTKTEVTEEETAKNIEESPRGLEEDTKSDKQPVPIQSKITFETDDNIGFHNTQLDPSSKELTDKTIKQEKVDNNDGIVQNEETPDTSENDRPSESVSIKPCEQEATTVDETSTGTLSSDDICDYPHFKINITETGAKEYICCINKQDNHFKTTLLISMKKHVQMKHSEIWDGYCFVCKVIVTPQGKHKFKECLQHYLDKHIDSFPILEKTAPEIVVPVPQEQPSEVTERTISPAPTKSYINVRPLSQLISKAIDIATQKEQEQQESQNFPVIQSVMSLGPPTVEPPRSSPSYPTLSQDKPLPAEPIFKYEEVQADIMSKKHRVVLETMMTSDRLIKVYKCAGRFCSFTSDSPEDALLHASTHQRIGGLDALRCTYCDFDPADNAIDLVMHVFKHHGMCQYCCGKCFYRAAASQSVGAHMTRVHGQTPAQCVVLRRTAVTATAAVEVLMLTRDQAVPYYVCAHVTSEGPCKFRTYTPDKFGEHLVQKHSGAIEHQCYLCPSVSPTAMDLIKHMKEHGLKLYQCTWCVHGADNEAELIAHVSSAHPAQQPQAYLRIITNKDGSSERRVLPLAFLNKLKVPTEDVVSRITKDDPVRDAERSIELEKLISQLVIQPVAPENPEEPFVDDGFEPEGPTCEPIDEPTIPETISETVPIVPIPVEPAVISSLSRPIVQSGSMDEAPATLTLTARADASGLNSNDPRTPTLELSTPQGLTITPVKKEPNTVISDAPHTEIVVLDSDEDEPVADKMADKDSNVIDLSDDDASKTNDYMLRKLPLTRLHKCPRCRIVCKNMNGLKKHIHHCYLKQDINPVDIQCPHCNYIVEDLYRLFSHYQNEHLEIQNIFLCGICQEPKANLNFVKKHIKGVHKEYGNVIVSSSKEKGGEFRYVVTLAPKAKVAPKRKLSATSGSDTSEKPPAKRRYTPQEIDQLPMMAVLGHDMLCALCEFSSKVRCNMVRHLQLHLDDEPVAQTAPVNPVPHLESNSMHFDKMLNLASSSISSKSAEKRAEPAPAPTPSVLAPEAAARYPRHVPQRQRFTCGAKDCSYISLDEAMLKCHWETLHADSTNFHCVHCPPNQTLDTTKPLTAFRVLSHLKMHDANLYACSSCTYYHFKKGAVEKHLSEIHKTGKLLIVREDVTPSTLPSPSTSGAPTMDLKAWQCGFCQFKSMLRPEVIDHCTKYHQSKMQFRCGYCPYRASAVENVNNHLSHSHSNKPEEILYYYYKEGSLPEPDGVPRWVKQQQKLGNPDPEVKTETQPSPPASPALILPSISNSNPPLSIDLNLVKKEIDDEDTNAEKSIEELCVKYGAFCDPNGIKYKCPLCKIVSEDTRDDMQSHLYEELKYRKWACALCTYKAFHKAGLLEHMASEHRRHTDLTATQIIPQPTDINIEKWVTELLDHQSDLITKLKDNFAKQKIITEKVATTTVDKTPTVETVEKYTVKCLKDNFGDFGAPVNKMFCCPKCSTTISDASGMKDHLEVELNKIRWCCTKCPNNFQTYHEAQFHCKSHDGSARPKEAMRQPAMRTAWITHTIEHQRKALLTTTAKTTTDNIKPVDENSLLVVRYEEKVSIPENTSVSRKRSRDTSDDEQDDPDYRQSKKKGQATCHHCGVTYSQPAYLKQHILRKHFNLKPFKCEYCDYSGSKQTVSHHSNRCHPGQPVSCVPTPIPPEIAAALKPRPTTAVDEPTKETNTKPEQPKLICLVCSKSFTEAESLSHTHDHIKAEFAKKGDVVVKCCVCLTLRSDIQSLEAHHNATHPDIPINYALFKLHYDTREIYICSYCNKRFKFIRDLKSHHSAVHVSMDLRYQRQPYPEDDDKRKESVLQNEPKRCARKSTTKLPHSKTVARKSTTKLPYSDPYDSTDDECCEYSYYKQKPTPLSEYSNVTTLMPFCNKMMPFTLKQLSEIILIDPRVVVQDIKRGS